MVICQNRPIYIYMKTKRKKLIKTELRHNIADLISRRVPRTDRASSRILKIIAGRNSRVTPEILRARVLAAAPAIVEYTTLVFAKRTYRSGVKRKRRLLNAFTVYHYRRECSARPNLYLAATRRGIPPNGCCFRRRTLRALNDNIDFRDPGLPYDYGFT